MPFKFKIVLPVLLAGLLSTAAAHTEITGMTPAAFSTVAAPKAVQLVLNEPVDLRFATVKVYPLKATGSQAALKQAAAALAKTALPAKNDAAARLDTGKLPSGVQARVTVPLKAALTAGNYAVMWRILSDDGHVVTGQSVFTVK